MTGKTSLISSLTVVKNSKKFTLNLVRPSISTSLLQEAAWKIQFVEVHKSPTYAEVFVALGMTPKVANSLSTTLMPNGGKFGLVLTQDMLDAAYAVGGWGGVFVLNGDNVVVTKVTIE